MSCSACAVQESSSFVAAQSNSNLNAVENKTNSVVAQESDKFRAIVPKATWEKIFFESINERVSSSKLSNLRSKGLPKDDFEVRIWSGFGLSLLQGFVLKRTTGEWSAVDLNWVVSENRKGKQDVKQLDKKFDVPKSGWDAAWQRLVDAGILTLPDAEEINCSGDALDGMSYVVEYNLKNTYRTYLYDNPNYAKCSEAKQMIKINKIIAEEFYKREVKVAD